MDEEVYIVNNKFNKMTPVNIIDEKKEVYIEALDYAFRDDDIRNIAITGIYGAGKSSVWKTYNYEKKSSKQKQSELQKEEDDKIREILNNVITVSMSKFNYSEKENNIKLETSENRVEGQIINQICAQICQKNIWMSKYRYKKNLTDLQIKKRYIAFLLLILSCILMWKINTICKNAEGLLWLIWLSLLIILFFVFASSLYYSVYLFYKENRVNISRINIKGNEFCTTTKEEEISVFDREIREIIYLLASSNTRVVVFEDLDRFQNINIFSKLRELNFLLNAYIKSNTSSSGGRVVRFIYMIQDGLFDSFDRTKFFDFILPVVPMADSKTSEDYLQQLMANNTNKPDDKFLTQISLYIDDMRMIKNIVNEYNVYSEVIPYEKLELDKNKLFSIVTLKNLFPREFDRMQKDYGILVTIFSEIDKYRQEYKCATTKNIERISNVIENYKNNVSTKISKIMATMIPSDISIEDNDGKTWAEQLELWSKNQNESFDISVGGNYYNLNYSEFVDKYIYSNTTNREIINEINDTNENKIKEMHAEILRLKSQLNEIDKMFYANILSIMPKDKIDMVFSNSLLEKIDNGILTNHYYGLIRFLVINGFIDETYWLYKSRINITSSKTLQRKDLIFMKNLFEDKDIDIMFEIESPDKVVKRLDISDFGRNNILNVQILHECIKKELKQNILMTIEMVVRKDRYRELKQILDLYDKNSIIFFISVLIDNNPRLLLQILEQPIYTEEFLLNAIQALLFRPIAADIINMFKDYIEKHEEILNFLTEKNFLIFFENIEKAKIKFISIKNFKYKENIMKEIERICAFKLTISNIVIIMQGMLKKEKLYFKLIRLIYSNSRFKSICNLINSNFNEVISEYISKCSIYQKKLYFRNSENILKKILLADIDEDLKEKYLSNEEAVIKNLMEIKNIFEKETIINMLLHHNKIKFSSYNVAALNDQLENKNYKYICEYLNSNISDYNFKNILSGAVDICNKIINLPYINERLLDQIHKIANIKIDNININLSEDIISKLVSYNLVNPTKDNINFLIDKKYYLLIIKLVKTMDYANETMIVRILHGIKIPEELTYMLINSGIRNENAITLLENLEDVKLGKIDQNKDAVITNIIERGLSESNIQYIYDNFEHFRYKDKFLEYLEETDLILEMDVKKIDEGLINFIMKSNIISINYKIHLLKKIILNRHDEELIKKCIICIPEIAGLRSLWKNKYPNANMNLYTREIADTLIEGGYAKIRRDNKIKYCGKLDKIKN